MAESAFRTIARIKFFVDRKKEQNYLKNGGAYMANSGISIEKQTSKLTQNSDQKVSTLPSQLKTGFENIDKKYASKLDFWQANKDSETLSYDRANELANLDLSGYFNEQTQKLDEKYGKKQQTLDEKALKAKQTFNGKMQKIESDFAKNQRDLEIEAIEKGWKVSSIYDKLSKDLKDQTNAKKLLLESDFSEESSALEFQKTLLEQEKQTALQNFNIAYAEKLDKKIQDLTNQFNTLNKNNIQKAETKLQHLYDSVYQEKGTEVLKYIQNLSRKQAQKFLDENYSDLLSELGSVVLRAVVAVVEDKK